MALDDRDTAFLRDRTQHQERCPSCLNRRTHLVPDANTPGSYFMGCDNCGHTWVGKDFAQNDQGETRLPIPSSEPESE